MRKLGSLLLLSVLSVFAASSVLGTHAVTTSNLPLSNAAEPLIANFTYSPTDVIVTKPVNFSDHSTGPIVLWQWNFGDDTFANATSPQNASKMHTYGSAGDVTVWLSIFDNQSGNNSTFATISVRKINTVLSLSNTTSTQGSAIVLTATLTDEFGNRLSGWEIDFYQIDNQGQHYIGLSYTDSIGRAVFNYEPPSSETFQADAVFSGTEIYAQATSQTQTFQSGLNLVPYALIGSLAVIFMSAIIAYLRWRSRKALVEEPSAPSEAR